jgi:hypothetical protein
MLGHKNTERHFSSGGNIEEIGHAPNLSANVAFPDSYNLSLPNHVHNLVPSDGPPRQTPGMRWVGKSISLGHKPPVFCNRTSEVVENTSESSFGEAQLFERQQGSLHQGWALRYYLAPSPYL